VLSCFETGRVPLWKRPLLAAVPQLVACEALVFTRLPKQRENSDENLEREEDE
jgi:hypothetical protein